MDLNTRVMNYLATQVAQLSVDLAVARSERDELREALDAVPATAGDGAATVKGEEATT